VSNSEKFIEYLGIINGTEGVSYHAISNRIGIDEQRLKNINTGRVKKVQEGELNRLASAYSLFLPEEAQENNSVFDAQAQIKALKEEVEQLKKSIFDLAEIKNTLNLILHKLDSQ